MLLLLLIISIIIISLWPWAFPAALSSFLSIFYACCKLFGADLKVSWFRPPTTGPCFTSRPIGTTTMQLLERVLKDTCSLVAGLLDGAMGADYCRAKKRAKPYMSISYRRGQGTPLVCLQIQTAVLWTWGHAGWDGVGAHWKKRRLGYISSSVSREFNSGLIRFICRTFPSRTGWKAGGFGFFHPLFQPSNPIKAQAWSLQQLGRPHALVAHWYLPFSVSSRPQLSLLKVEIFLSN